MGFEPTTSSLARKHSSQLNYRRVINSLNVGRKTWDVRGNVLHPTSYVLRKLHFLFGEMGGRGLPRLFHSFVVGGVPTTLNAILENVGRTFACYGL